MGAALARPPVSTPMRDTCRATRRRVRTVMVTAVTMADLCLVSHATGYRVFKGTIDNHPDRAAHCRALHDRRALRQRAAAAPAGRAGGALISRAAIGTCQGCAHACGGGAHCAVLAELICPSSVEVQTTVGYPGKELSDGERNGRTEPSWRCPGKKCPSRASSSVFCRWRWRRR